MRLGSGFSGLGCRVRLWLRVGRRGRRVVRHRIVQQRARIGESEAVLLLLRLRLWLRLRLLRLRRR